MTPLEPEVQASLIVVASTILIVWLGYGNNNALNQRIICAIELCGLAISLIFTDSSSSLVSGFAMIATVFMMILIILTPILFGGRR